MSKPKRPEHCKGCISFHNAGRKDPKGGLEKYNSWCCAHGTPAVKAISWCKIHSAKKVTKLNLS